MEVLDFVKRFIDKPFVSDSRNADEKSVFFALKGTKYDGHDFLQKVYDQGCRVFVVEDSSFFNNLKNIDVLKVEDSSSVWALGWKLKSQNPDLDLFLVGITGTNGKTSTSLMVEHILNHFNIPCGVLGTIDHHVRIGNENKVWPTSLTTPGADILYPRLNEMKQAGAKAVALEISSHALDQNRAKDLFLDAAIFSNITNDHLDYHKTMEHYYSSKIKLFEELLRGSLKKNKVSVLNYNDETIKGYLPNFGCVEVLLEIHDQRSLNKNSKILDLYQKIKVKNANAKLNLVYLKKHNLDGLKFSLILDFDPMKELNVLEFVIPILGHFQMLNWCQAVLSLSALNLNSLELINSAQSFLGVPGRLQKVLNSKSKAVFVDYAHTPDALQRALESLRQVCKGKLGVVFGCGGDRDNLKRPLMGQVAEEFSDFQILTNDNPRSENPNEILSQILGGFKHNLEEPYLITSNQTFETFVNIKNSHTYIEPDRKKAIRLGLNLMHHSEDVLLIAGKGHENYQILKDKTIDFSDYKAVEDLTQN